LVELLAVIVVMSLALSLLSVSWHLLTRVHRRTDQAIQETRMVERLSIRFRIDMREAASAEVLAADAPGRGWDLHMEDGRVVEYRHSAGGIDRFDRRGDDVAHRELYRLPDWAEVRFTPPGDMAQASATLSFYRHRASQDLNVAPPSASQPWLVVASPVTRARGTP
jgi:type II secretory pathway pseudopilin PulG